MGTRKIKKRLTEVTCVIFVLYFLYFFFSFNRMISFLRSDLDELSKVLFSTDKRIGLLENDMGTLSGQSAELDGDLVQIRGALDKYHYESCLHIGTVAENLREVERKVVSLSVLEEKLNEISIQAALAIPVDLESRIAESERDQALEVLENSPDNRESLYLLGKICFEEGDLVSSAMYLEKLIELEPFHEEAFSLLGRINRKNRDYIKSVYLYKRLVDLKPENTFYINNLAWALSGAGRCDEAVAAIESSLLINSETVITLNLAGDIFRKSGFYDRSREAYEKSLSLLFKPDTAANLGDLLISSGLKDEAIFYWDSAVSSYKGLSIEEDRKIKALYGKMAKASISLGRYRAVDEYFRIMEERGGDQEVFYLYLNALQLRGKDRLFDEKLNTFYSRYPDSPHYSELAAMQSERDGV